jgi:hypothetical protein
MEREPGFYAQATFAEEPTSSKDYLWPMIEEIAPLV